MLKVFNALQIVTIFSAWPFLINWLRTASFDGSQAAFYISIIAYMVGFWGMTGLVFVELDKK